MESCWSDCLCTWFCSCPSSTSTTLPLSFRASLHTASNQQSHLPNEPSFSLQVRLPLHKILFTSARKCTLEDDNFPEKIPFWFEFWYLIVGTKLRSKQVHYFWNFSFVLRNSQKKLPGILWQSQFFTREFQMASDWDRSRVIPRDRPTSMDSSTIERYFFQLEE